MSFHAVTYTDTDRFWKSFGDALQASVPNIKLEPIASSQDFLGAFLSNVWPGRNIIIFVDEFSEMFCASDGVRDEILRSFREIRNNRHAYAIWSIFVCGTFSIMNLSSTDPTILPFNAANYVQNPYFTLQQTRQLFDEYQHDAGITIDTAVIDDIWFQSNGCAIHLTHLFRIS